MFKQLTAVVFASFLLAESSIYAAASPAAAHNKPVMRTVTSFTAQLVTVDTTLPVAEVLSRLDVECNKNASAPLLSLMQASKSREDIQHAVSSVTGSKDFVYFNDYPMNWWLNVYNNVTDTPVTVTYVIGNPVIAETIIRYDMRATYNIPPRLLVLEKADHSGTQVIYHLPSSVMVLINNPNLKAAALALDKKLDNMVAKITAVQQ